MSDEIRERDSLEKNFIEKEITLDASPEEVWKALTEGEQLKNWFPLEARVTPGVGGKMFLSWGPGWEGEGEITKWEPNKVLAWKESSGMAMMEWTIERRGGKTVLRMVQNAFADGGDWSDEYFDSLNYGWVFMLTNLRLVLEKHPTVSRDVAWPRVSAPLEREVAYRKLTAPGGLFREDSSKLQPGEIYTLTSKSGKRFTGEVQFVRAPRGFCVGVRELNDALLWLTIESGGEGKIDAQLWLSSYGIPTGSVKQFEQEWQQRLQEILAQ